MQIKDRLLQFITYKSISVRKFEITCGLSNGYVNNMRKSIQPDKVKTIALNFPELNTGWLMTGEGEMLKSKAAFQANAIIQEPGRRVMTVPLIGQYAYGGYLMGYADPEYLEHQPFVAVTEEYTPGNYVAFEIRGHSMDDGTRNAICEGDIVIGRELYREHWTSKFRKNEVYIIVHKEDGICIKEIVKHDPVAGIIKCHSWNREYEDFELRLDEVVQIFYKKELRRR